MPPGTIHALGPGLIVYEVQQTSDLTYRVYDWGRPPIAGRELHIEKSLAVTNPLSAPRITPAPDLNVNDRSKLAACEYFTLEMLQASSTPIELDTQEQTFHALTVVSGAAEVVTSGGAIMMNRLESAVIPAACRKYQVIPRGELRILKASVDQIL